MIIEGFEKLQRSESDFIYKYMEKIMLAYMI